MKSPTARALSMLLLSLLFCGPRAQAADAKTESLIRQLEDRRFKAMREADTGTLDRLLAADLTYSHSSGRVESKDQFIESLRSGQLSYQSITPEEVTVRVHRDTAIVTGRAAMKVKQRGQESSFNIRFIDIYFKRQGNWQMVAWQSTRLAE